MQLLSFFLIPGLVFGHGWAVRPVNRAALNPRIYEPAMVAMLAAAPLSISFSATDPDLSPILGSPASVFFTATAGSSSNNWTLSVQAAASSFSGCSTIPVSAITVRCTSASVVGTGGTGGCNGSFTLSTSPQQVAGGKEAAALGNYSVSLAFSFNDSWRYIAALAPTCSLSLTYTAVAP